jgi:hypothetical protein
MPLMYFGIGASGGWQVFGAKVDMNLSRSKCLLRIQISNDLRRNLEVYYKASQEGELCHGVGEDCR